MNRAIIFLGPTLSREEACAEFDAIYLDPVAQGDVYRAARERPFAIGIIDGYFERVPAVWHKEILWALTQRIHVFGASSMGALRAAELSRFGMKGVGEIFKAYDTGELEDDDEVAVAHGDASTGYRTVSEPMVNIRATLKIAESSNVIGAQLRQQLESLAKGLFYPDRSFPQLYVLAAEHGVPKDEIEALRTFVSSNRVDQKRADALELLRAMRECCELGEPLPAPTFSFAHTEAWDQVVDWAETQPPITLQSQSSSADQLAAEARLLGASGQAIVSAGFNRAVANALARRLGLDDEPERSAKRDRAIRQSAGAGPGNGSNTDAHFDRWLEQQGLTNESYEDFLQREARLEWLKERYRDDLNRHIVDELRQTGLHAQLALRANEKEKLLAKHLRQSSKLEDAGLNRSELFTWYFEQRLGCPVPRDLDIFLTDNGLESVSALEHEALREYLYLRLGGESQLDTRDLFYGTNPANLHRPDSPT